MQWSFDMEIMSWTFAAISLVHDQLASDLKQQQQVSGRWPYIKQNKKLIEKFSLSLDGQLDTRVVARIRNAHVYIEI